MTVAQTTRHHRRAAALTIDAGGVVTAANPAARRLFGVTDLVGRDAVGLLPALDRLGASVPQAVRPDGTTLRVEMSVSPAGSAGERIAVVRPAGCRVRVSRAVLRAVAQERQAIGQELHDGIGQELTGLGLLAGALVRGAGRDPTVDRELADKIAVGLARVYRQVRLVSRGLVPAALPPGGLPTALAELAARTREQAGVVCTADTAGAVPTTDSGTAADLLRIAQEAVTNALRHARPRRIAVALLGGPGWLTLTVRDDGVGLPAGGRGGGLGLRLMGHRAARIGGTLTVRPAAGRGTVVTCTLRGQS